MINETYNHLVSKLVEKTRENKVNWQPTVNSDAFAVYFQNFSLAISTEYDREADNSSVVVVLRNQEGKEIDQFAVSSGEANFEELIELYSSARRKALKIDEAVQILLKELTGDKPIGLDRPLGEDTSSAKDDLPF